MACLELTEAPVRDPGSAKHVKVVMVNHPTNIRRGTIMVTGQHSAFPPVDVRLGSVEAANAIALRKRCLAPCRGHARIPWRCQAFKLTWPHEPAVMRACLAAGPVAGVANTATRIYHSAGVGPELPEMLLELTGAQSVDVVNDSAVLSQFTWTTVTCGLISAAVSLNVHVYPTALRVPLTDAVSWYVCQRALCAAIVGIRQLAADSEPGGWVDGLRNSSPEGSAEGGIAHLVAQLLELRVVGTGPRHTQRRVRDFSKKLSAPKLYGGGRKCESAYRQSGSACVQCPLPPMAPRCGPQYSTPADVWLGRAEKEVGVSTDRDQLGLALCRAAPPCYWPLHWNALNHSQNIRFESANTIKTVLAGIPHQWGRKRTLSD